MGSTLPAGPDAACTASSMIQKAYLIYSNGKLAEDCLLSVTAVLKPTSAADVQLAEKGDCL